MGHSAAGCGLVPRTRRVEILACAPGAATRIRAARSRARLGQTSADPRVVGSAELAGRKHVDVYEMDGSGAAI